ncbi:unnamed protein product [Caenorhabditis sp. 36 PRJEB53466]|nr:unnamed protein product [Caenorhabditis sp. 36 PRJEB53466]
MFCWYIGNVTQIVMAVNRFLVDHTTLSYSYFLIEDVPNYTDQSDIPLNALSSIVPVICYSWIYYTIRSASQSISPSMRTELQKQRGHQELAYAMQFSLISMFYTFVWILFRVFSIIFGGRQVEWSILTSLCHVFNCSANAFVYIMFNKEIRSRLSSNKFFRFSGIVASEAGGSFENNIQSRVHAIQIQIPSARPHSTS